MTGGTLQALATRLKMEYVEAVATFARRTEDYESDVILSKYPLKSKSSIKLHVITDDVLNAKTY